MSIKYPLELNRILKYSGVMNADDLHKIADDFLVNREYDRYGERSKFISTPEGRVIEIQTRYEKQYTDDDIFELKLRMYFADLKPVTVEVDGKKVKMDKGRVKITFETYMIVNQTGHWGGSPIKALFQYIAAFFIFKHHLDDLRDDAKKDANQLYDMLLHFLNGSNN